MAGVVAESFAPTFWSIEIAAGFPLISCPGILDNVQRWDEIEVDYAAAQVRNLTKGTSLPMDPLSEAEREALRVEADLLAAREADTRARRTAESRLKAVIGRIEARIATLAAGDLARDEAEMFVTRAHRAMERSSPAHALEELRSWGERLA